MSESACTEEEIHITIKEEIPLTHYVLYNEHIGKEALILFPHSLPSTGYSIIHEMGMFTVLHDLMCIPFAKMQQSKQHLPAC